jgi:hypothetical protein
VVTPALGSIAVVLSDDRIRTLATELCAVPGVRAVALGGSRARRTHRPDSDVDLGLYVEPSVDLRAIEAVADPWADGTATVAPRGGWGPWVDAGAWLTIDGTAVDLILRDVARVEEQCARAARGEFAFHAQAGHPLGFLDVAYAGEVATCVPLCDPDGLLHRLSTSATPYPEPLRTALIANLWQVDFLLDGAQKGAKGMDVAYVALCAATATMFVAHAWHAAADSWVTNEKGVIPNVAHLPIDSGGFAASAAALLGAIGTTTDELLTTIERLRALPRPAPTV